MADPRSAFGSRDKSIAIRWERCRWERWRSSPGASTDSSYGASQANELRVLLMQILSNEPVELLAGNHVIEVRPHGLQKGRIARDVSATAPAGALFVGRGDDRTDEDLFAALPPDGVAIHVGPRPSQATIWLPDSVAARRFLRALVTPS